MDETLGFAIPAVRTRFEEGPLASTTMMARSPLGAPMAARRIGWVCVAVLLMLPGAQAGAGPVREACEFIVDVSGVGDDGPGICDAVCEPLHVSLDGNVYVESECLDFEQEVGQCSTRSSSASSLAIDFVVRGCSPIVVYMISDGVIP